MAAWSTAAEPGPGLRHGRSRWLPRRRGWPARRRAESGRPFGSRCCSSSVVSVPSRFGGASGLWAAGVAGLLPGCLGSAWIVACHAVESFVDAAHSGPGSGEFRGVREGLADVAASVGHLAAGVVDVGEYLGLACLQFGEAVFQAGDQADGISVAEAGGGQVERGAGCAFEVDGHFRGAEGPVHLGVDGEPAELPDAHGPAQLPGHPGRFSFQDVLEVLPGVGAFGVVASRRWSR